MAAFLWGHQAPLSFFLLLPPKYRSPGELNTLMKKNTATQCKLPSYRSECGLALNASQSTSSVAVAGTSRKGFDSGVR